MTAPLRPARRHAATPKDIDMGTGFPLDAPSGVDLSGSGMPADMPAAIQPAGANAPYGPRDARLKTILLIARLSTDGRDDLCRVRDISAGGARIETLVGLDVGQDVTVEFKNGIGVRAQVAWTGKSEAGLRFDAPTDVGHLLAQSVMAPVVGAQVPRGPRLSALCPVALQCGGRILPGILENVSQGGAQVRLSGLTPIGSPIVFIIPGLESIHAVIRRQIGATVGIGFVDKLGFADLSQWLAGPERFSAEAATTAFKLNRRSS